MNYMNRIYLLQPDLWPTCGDGSHNTTTTDKIISRNQQSQRWLVVTSLVKVNLV